MKKLLLSLALCATLFGCSVQSATKVELISDQTLKAAVDGLNAAYMFGTYSKAEHDSIGVFVHAADAALQKYHDDLASGKVDLIQADLNAFNSAALMVITENKKVHPK